MLDAAAANAGRRTDMIRFMWHRTALALLLTVLAVDAVAAERKVRLRDAVDQVQRDTGGKILAAQTVGHGQSKAYRIKVLTQDGRVRVVQVQARTQGKNQGER
jgi:uncharacterized membrane protein YidH (DUF202 family)